jgi:ankyrin repeat protein
VPPGWTPLLRAARCARPAVVELLLAHPRIHPSVAAAEAGIGAWTQIDGELHGTASVRQAFARWHRAQAVCARAGAPVPPGAAPALVAVLAAAKEAGVTAEALSAARTADGFTALGGAVAAGASEWAVGGLLAAGCSALVAGDREGASPSALAARAGNAELSAQLHHAACWAARAPLNDAASRGHASTVAVLLAAGADVSIADAGGRTALIWAARFAHPAVVELLLAHPRIHPSIAAAEAVIGTTADGGGGAEGTELVRQAFARWHRIQAVCIQAVCAAARAPAPARPPAAGQAPPVLVAALAAAREAGVSAAALSAGRAADGFTALGGAAAAGASEWAVRARWRRAAAPWWRATARVRRWGPWRRARATPSCPHSCTKRRRGRLRGRSRRSCGSGWS